MTGPKFINIYGLCCCCASSGSLDSSGTVVLVLLFVTNSSAVQTHLLILKFRAGVVSFWHPEDPVHWASPWLPWPDPGSALSSHVVAIVTHTRTIFFTRISYYTHTHTPHSGNYPFLCGRVLAGGNPWQHKGWDEVNRITYTNYHRHCAPAFKNIFLLILFEVTPQKFLLFQLRQQLGKIFNWDPAMR